MSDTGPQSESSETCRCQCGAVAFSVASAPAFRMICHCSICQRFNNADYADVLVYRKKQVIQPAPNAVVFSTYKPPPNVKRGRCASCRQAAIEVFDTPLFPKLIMVPRGMFSESAVLPPPVGHVFYEGRVRDATDDLKTYSGFVASQMAFFKHLLW